MDLYVMVLVTFWVLVAVVVALGARAILRRRNQ